MPVDETPLSLDDYQRRAAETDQERHSADPITPLLGLSGEVGTLLSEFKKKHRDDGCAYTGFEQVAREEIGDVLWYLAALARRENLGLEEIARANLAKTRARWLDEPDRNRLNFDAEFQPGQQLPGQFEVEFSTSEDEEGRKFSQMRVFGEELGDPIEDNSRFDDHYRFHDIFHISYAAVLGWSPILRSLLKRKRKDDPETDRAEDGARAAIIEEAVVALVFNMAFAYNSFKGAERVDDAILAAVQTVTARLEVGVCTARDWERAILTGFEVWHQLCESDGGTVAVDLDRGELRFST